MLGVLRVVWRDEQFSAVDLFPISDRDNLYPLVGSVNDIEDSVVADPYSRTFAAVKFIGIVREGIVLQRAKGGNDSIVCLGG